MEVTGSEWSEAKVGIQTIEIVLFAHMLLLCSTNQPLYRLKSHCFLFFLGFFWVGGQFSLQPRHFLKHLKVVRNALIWSSSPWSDYTLELVQLHLLLINGKAIIITLHIKRLMVCVMRLCVFWGVCVCVCVFLKHCGDLPSLCGEKNAGCLYRKEFSG